MVRLDKNQLSKLEELGRDLVTKEIGPDVMEIVSKLFDKRGLNDAGIPLEDILRALNSERIPPYFRETKSLFDGISETSSPMLVDGINGMKSAFFDRAEKNNFPGELVIGYILFSDYVLNSTVKLEDAVESTGKRIEETSSAIPNLNKKIAELEERFYVKAYLLLKKAQENSLVKWFIGHLTKSEESQAKGKLKRYYPKDISDYLSGKDELKQRSAELEQLKKYLASLEGTLEGVRAETFGLKDKIMKKHMLFNANNTEEPPIYILAISRMRYEDAGKMFEEKKIKSGSDYRVLIDAAIKYVIALRDDEEKFKIILKEKAHFEKSENYSINRAGIHTSTIAYISHYILYNYRRRGGLIDANYIRKLYYYFNEAYKKINTLSRETEIERNGELSMAAHSLNHSHKQFYNFLMLLKQDSPRARISIVDREDITETFYRLYLRFLSITDSLLKRGIIKSSDRASFKNNIYDGLLNAR